MGVSRSNTRYLIKLTPARRLRFISVSLEVPNLMKEERCVKGIQVESTDLQANFERCRALMIDGKGYVDHPVWSTNDHLDEHAYHQGRYSCPVDTSRSRHQVHHRSERHIYRERAHLRYRRDHRALAVSDLEEMSTQVWSLELYNKGSLVLRTRSHNDSSADHHPKDKSSLLLAGAPRTPIDSR